MATSLVSTGVQFPDATIQTTAATAGGKGTNVQTFTSSGTWTKPSGYNANSRVLIQCWGGGGGGAIGSSAGNNCGGGGGGGGYNYRWVTLSSLGATVTVTIGAGGAAIGPTTGSFVGNTGGTTSFGTTVYAYGGGGGGTRVYGGGGGGQLSAGSVGSSGSDGDYGYSGAPFPQRNYYTNTTQFLFFEGSGGVAALYSAGVAKAQTLADGGSGYYKGGGGGLYVLGDYGTTFYAGIGGNSVWGGGGGAGATNDYQQTTFGISQYAGNGGRAYKNANGVAGTAPSGGGGGCFTLTTPVTTGAGAAGQCIVTVFDGT